MSLDTKESLRQMSGAFLCKPIGRAMCNPLTFAIMLTVVIMIIVVCTYDRDHIFRTVFRIFTVATLFLFINNHVLMEDMNCKQLNTDQRNILQIVEKGSDRSSGESLVVPTRAMDENTSLIKKDTPDGS